MYEFASLGKCLISTRYFHFAIDSVCIDMLAVIFLYGLGTLSLIKWAASSTIWALSVLGSYHESNAAYSTPYWVASALRELRFASTSQEQFYFHEFYTCNSET